MSKALRLTVRGLVQGVGFRPHVWRLAHEQRLVGWVRNGADGVEIHLEGEEASLAGFCDRLLATPPTAAQIEELVVEPAALCNCHDFLIADSSEGRVTTRIGADRAPCPACLSELFDPRDRRWRHPFITCTFCGPRYTITHRLPYDRPQTSMAPFAFCADCAREYRDPADRRFHAETTCCPQCGPRLRLVDKKGGEIVGDPIAMTLALLSAGQIVAIKGLGGFHLACDARNAAAVAALRQRKAREEKPFAVMVANVASARRWAEVGADAAALLTSLERPIVLLPKRREQEALLSGVAPGLAELGVMLPVTPIHYLLFHEAAGRPAGMAWLDEVQAPIWVMTSANPHGEPLVIDDQEAFRRLAGIVDAFLVHDRGIVLRCDDSVRRVDSFVRRARGYVPQPIKLPAGGPAVLAVGGCYKNTVCITRGEEAYVSQHVGDLDNPAACRFLAETVSHLLAILDVEPKIVAHDRHPDFYSTRFALAWAEERKLPTLAVQHHHAHIAAVCAEHGITEPVLGLALDGVGFGEDGTAWGGELLMVDGAHSMRLGHLRELPLPGGDVAAREPWRMAASVLAELGRGEEIPSRFADEPAAPLVATMLARRLNCPLTSSAGRLFDAAAGLLGVRRRIAFEGQAAMLLEGLAARHGVASPLAGGWRIDAEGHLDLLPLFDALGDCEDASAGAALFHATFAAALCEWVAHAAARTGLTTVVAAGGCLLNRLLQTALRGGLAAHKLRFVQAERLPPNDGGLSLGQAWVALTALSRRTS